MSALRLAIIGAGPAGLTLAIYLLSRCNSFARPLQITLFDREADHDHQDRSNPDRSYTIDITGHGLKAVEEIGPELVARLDRELIHFNGIHAYPLNRTLPYEDKGWTGSRGDICSALLHYLRDSLQASSDTCELIPCWQCEVEKVDPVSGEVHFRRTQLTTREQDQFDLVVAADGAGSSLRRFLAAEKLLEIRKFSIPNYSRILHLDEVDTGVNLDPTLLHVFSLQPWAVGGAILDETSVRASYSSNGTYDAATMAKQFYVQMGYSSDHEFSGTEQLVNQLQGIRFKPAGSDAMTNLASQLSEGETKAFAERPVYHTGKTVISSCLSVHKVVLLGDAAIAFPPVGQGVNAAMESAVVLGAELSQSLFATENPASGADLVAAATRYNQLWLPQAEACADIANSVVYGSRISMLRALVQGVIAQLTRIEMAPAQLAKEKSLSYCEAQQLARSRNRMALVTGLALLVSLLLVLTH